VTHYVADVTKARELLGYEPQVPLDEGIKRSVAWFREWRAEHPEENAEVIEDPDRTPGDIPHGFKQPAGTGA